MDTEQSNETEAFEDQPKKENIIEDIKDQENSPNKKSNFEASDSAADIMKQINEEAEKLDTIIDKNDIKVFSKYEDLDEKELEKLLDEKNENILKLNNQKEETKNNLNLFYLKFEKLVIYLYKNNNY